jgi:hypothetical protein
MSVAHGLDPEREELREILRQIRHDFDGRYGDELKRLMGLSEADLIEISPDPATPETYAALIEVVRDASRRNLAVGHLQARVRALGTVAVAIARRVGGLAALV